MMMHVVKAVWQSAYAENVGDRACRDDYGDGGGQRSNGRPAVVRCSGAARYASNF